MLDQAFFEFLEYKICDAFDHSDNEEVKGFWCDGVLPDNTYTQKFVNDNRKITLLAFIGKDGQDEYELTLKFGKKALSRHARNLDITECILKPDKPDWFEIDTERKKIVIQLD